MLAVSLDDFRVMIIDIDTRKIVRTFQGHHNAVTDMVRQHFNFELSPFIVVQTVNHIAYLPQCFSKFNDYMFFFLNCYSENYLGWVQ